MLYDGFMPEKFVINGGNPLKGEIEVRGSKNAATPILAATLLTDQPCIIDNIPLVEDVFRMIEILEDLGADVEWLDKRKIRVQAKKIASNIKNKSLVTKMRSSVLIIGPLLARLGMAEINKPGGCIIGVRPIDVHLNAFRDLGVIIDHTNDFYSLKTDGIKGGHIVLDEFSVTATENVMMAAALCSNKTIIDLAACEPHVQDLAVFLKKMGVRIKGEGTHTIEIIGNKELKGARHKIQYDYIEAGTYILMASTVGGCVTVKNTPVGSLQLVLKNLKSFGANVEIIDNETVLVKESSNMRMDSIQALPYPGIPTDLQSMFGVLATQTINATLIHDPLYEGRLKYLEELNKMGAKIIVCDPHRAIISGPTQLYGADLRTFDLRGGAALISAGLTAKGTTTIYNMEQIDRGYEKIEERLQGIGAQIKRIISES
ncbi:MAG TPA: UDP-N-acetylglucosamine 1-carboxyvinyltransferase [Candidatus Pacearchaeota archaeon]|jgi:UDP-N-acetylglucosamine 1-carboxyvinyltransferase|nr:UDP-N-acetylglucosamine 1-carboxyvinyltransferase [Candidatus Pacearchaeota archaeon]